MSRKIISKKVKPTKMQYEILILRAMKVKYPDIQSQLSISKATMMRHLTNLKIKFFCFSQTDLINFAKSQGWISSFPRPSGEVEHEILPYEDIMTVRVFTQID